MDDNTLAKLRLLKFSNEQNEPFSAFVALTDQQLSDLLNADNCNLEPYKRHILLIVKGDTPSVQDHKDAEAAFRHCYGSVVRNPHSIKNSLAQSNDAEMKPDPELHHPLTPEELDTGKPQA
jgi:hypothetical protein